MTMDEIAEKSLGQLACEQFTQNGNRVWTELAAPAREIWEKDATAFLNNANIRRILKDQGYSVSGRDRK